MLKIDGTSLSASRPDAPLEGPPGSKRTLVIRRGSVEQTVDVTLAE